MQEIHLTKKDFKLEWYSGSGAGGQHRNKHQNCCRITHIESGLTVNGTESRSRVSNQTSAFNKLARMVISWYSMKELKEKELAEDTIRTYHAVRNEVKDHESGFKMPFKEVINKGNIEPMIEARRIAT